jgi:hypothetical protein
MRVRVGSAGGSGPWQRALPSGRSRAQEVSTARTLFPAVSPGNGACQRSVSLRVVGRGLDHYETTCADEAKDRYCHPIDATDRVERSGTTPPVP